MRLSSRARGWAGRLPRVPRTVRTQSRHSRSSASRRRLGQGLQRMRNCAALLLLLGSCPALYSQVPSLRKLNLVLVTIDTLRADRLGCYGYTKIETPNLDQLAKQGVLFENAVTHTPLTAPSPASLFTGLSPTVPGVRDTGGFILPSSRLTIAVL